MKKGLKIVLMILVFCFCTTIYQGNVSAANKKPVYTISKKSKLMNVGSHLYTTYSSDYVNKYTRDWYLFRSYLEKLEVSGGGTLIVKKGTYNITNTLCIPSNVDIIFEDGVVINKTIDTHTKKFTAGVTLFEFVPAAKYNKKNWCKDYNGVHDSRMIGKGKVIINTNKVYQSVAVTMCHNKNITIKGITFENLRECHFIELDASKNVKILKCKFNNADGYDYNREAINIDTPDDSTHGFSKPWAKNDKTPNDKILIKKCKFKDVIVAVGTHRYSEDGGVIYHRNITIEDCTIKRAQSNGINCLAWALCKIKNNNINSEKEAINEENTFYIKKSKNKKSHYEYIDPDPGNVPVPVVVPGYNPVFY